MAGWHHWLDGRESQWTPGVGDGQGGLACCDSWGSQRVGHDWATDLIWSDIYESLAVYQKLIQYCKSIKKKERKREGIHVFRDFGDKTWEDHWKTFHYDSPSTPSGIQLLQQIMLSKVFTVSLPILFKHLLQFSRFTDTELEPQFMLSIC